MPERHDAVDDRPARKPGGASSQAYAACAAEQRLLAALAKGDHAALTALYQAWFPRALGLARTMTRRGEAFCLDVVQDSFIRVIDHAPRLAEFARTSDLDRWMAAIVRTAAIDLLRREARRIAREHAVADLGRDGHEQHKLDELHALIASLDPDDRELLLLRFGHGNTLEGAARAVGTTIGAAYGRIRRALGKLGTHLKEVDHE